MKRYVIFLISCSLFIFPLTIQAFAPTLAIHKYTRLCGRYEPIDEVSELSVEEEWELYPYDSMKKGFETSFGFCSSKSIEQCCGILGLQYEARNIAEKPTVFTVIRRIAEKMYNFFLIVTQGVKIQSQK